MLYIVLAVICLLNPSIRSFLLSIFSYRKNYDNHDEVIIEKLAEIDGGNEKLLSVFDHIEQGLKNNPDGPAVICTFQAENHLDDLFANDERTQRQVLARQLPNGDTHTYHEPNGQINGNFDKEIQRNGALWMKEPNGSNSDQCGFLWDKQPLESHSYTSVPVKEETTIKNTPLDSTFLTLTYNQLHCTAVKLACGLLAYGAKSNSTLLMVIPNGSEYTILLWTCILLRITYVSLDPSMLDISGFTALKQMLQMLKPQLIVAPDPLSGKALDVAVSELELPEPIRISLATTSSSHTHDWRYLADIAMHEVKHSVEEAIVTAAREHRTKGIHSIMFTSGTSGLPKGCPLRVSGMSHVLHSQSWLIDSESGAIALQQPHNSRGIAPAQTLQTWKAGGAVIMTGQEFNVRHATEAIRRFGVTFIVLTPPMVHEMAAELAIRPLDVGSVKKVQLGGDAITKDILNKCTTMFPKAKTCVNHGMTEGPGSFTWPFFETPVSATPFFGDIAPIGKVAPGAVIRVWDSEKKRVVGRGELGDLHISCPSLIRHYLAGRSEESFYNNQGRRWFITGDVAMVNENGLVFILGRRKDMIKRANVLVTPVAIESSIEAFTGAQAIVVQVPHHVLGAEPFAVLSKYHGKSDTQIKHHVRKVLGRDYALGGLASLEQLGLVQFPLNSTRKVVRSKVQAAMMDYIKRNAGITVKAK